MLLARIKDLEAENAELRKKRFESVNAHRRKTAEVATISIAAIFLPK